jgi:sugar lactone lactonase YvrE
MTTTHHHRGRRQLGRVTLFLAAALVSIATTAPATPALSAVRPMTVPPVIRAQGPHLYPEGVAWDPTRQAFLVGSARTATVSVVGPSGSTRPLIRHPDLVSTFGLTVDAARNRVLVTYADIGVGENSGPATQFTQSGLLIADLRTGRARYRVDLGPGAANDVTVAPDGTAYVTDTVGDAVVAVDVRGRVQRRITDPRFVSDSFGVNGIVARPDGSVVVGRYDTGRLFRIDRRGTVHDVELSPALPGADGLALTPDGALLVSTNTLGASGSDAVHVLRSADGWRSARETAARAWPDPAPTTLALTPAGAYALSGRLDLLNAGDTSTTTFTLRRL